jgi:hypothetical protein
VRPTAPGSACLRSWGYALTPASIRLLEKLIEVSTVIHLPGYGAESLLFGCKLLGTPPLGSGRWSSGLSASDVSLPRFGEFHEGRALSAAVREPEARANHRTALIFQPRRYIHCQTSMLRI